MGAYPQQEKQNSKKLQFRIYENRRQNTKQKKGWANLMFPHKRRAGNILSELGAIYSNFSVPLEGQTSFHWNMTYFAFEDASHAVPSWAAPVYLFNPFFPVSFQCSKMQWDKVILQ